MIKWRWQRKKAAQGVQLAEGMVLRLDAGMQTENRAYTLLLKAVIVYLIVMGGMGCYLSAVRVEYASWVVHLVIFGAACFCSLLYYSERWQNFGYFLLFLVMAGTGVSLRNYINSGFYSVANDLAEEASAFFDSNAMRSYGEQIGNRGLAITVSMCYIGCVCCIFMNILISRRMQYVIAIPLCAGILLMPLYLELEPSLWYVAMLVSGLTSAYMVKGNGHYKLSQNNSCFVWKKKQLSYLYASRVLATVMAAVFLLTVLLTQLLGLIFPVQQFQDAHPASRMKQQTMDTVENISLMGLMGLFNFYPSTGGLTNGALGGINSVRLDFETDLTIEFAPYTEERMYFKTFTGAAYNPYYNNWSRRTDRQGQEVRETADLTVKHRKRAFRRSEENTARGKIKIKNKAAAIGVYLPYYSEEVDQVIYPGQEQEYTFYPMLHQKSLSLPPEPEESWKGQWLDVPEENREVVDNFCKEAGLRTDGTMEEEEAVRVLAAYYQENLPYTYRPGATPYRKDFINYFLGENRRGYCAHFASAAVLIFRYLGIPARYIEGYAVDPQDISEEGTLLSDRNYSDYYEGDSPLGQTAVVSVDVTDANAHAWVELYSRELGWHVVEVTPASDEDESVDNNLWQRLMRFLGGGRQSGVDEGAQDGGDAVVDDTTTQVSRDAAGLVLLLLLSAVAGQWLVRRLIAGRRYRLSSRNDKLVIRYQEFMRRMRRRYPVLRERTNYEEQFQWLTECGLWEMSDGERDHCLSVMNRAGFSQREISQEELEGMLLLMKQIKIKKKGERKNDE